MKKYNNFFGTTQIFQIHFEIFIFSIFYHIISYNMNINNLIHEKAIILKDAIYLKYNSIQKNRFLFIKLSVKLIALS